MGRIWVVNASPLISLARIGRLDLLEGPQHGLNVPEAVAKEVLAGPPSDPARQALEAGFGGQPTDTPIDLRVVEWGLGAGETAVLSQAMLTGGTAVLDDGRARTAARVLGVKVIGTLGVVLNARQTQRMILRRLCFTRCRTPECGLMTQRSRLRSRAASAKSGSRSGVDDESLHGECKGSCSPIAPSKRRLGSEKLSIYE